jgi:hypothetical protein
MNDDPYSPFVSRAAQAVLIAQFAVLVEADGRVLDAHVTLPSWQEPEHLILDGVLVEALRRFHFLPARSAVGAQRGWSTLECALRLGPAGPVRQEAAGGPRRLPDRHGHCQLVLRSRSEDRECR